MATSDDALHFKILTLNQRLISHSLSMSVFNQNMAQNRHHQYTTAVFFKLWCAYHQDT